MSKTTIIAKTRPDGRLVRVMPDGAEQPLPDPMDLAAFHALTDEEVLEAARSDPDARPREDYPAGRLRRVPQVKVIRRALGLTQEEFSARFQIPVGTLRDWEQGRTEPDQANKAYLKVIASEPDAVTRALSKKAANF